MIKWLDRCLVIGPYYALCTSAKDYRKALARLKCNEVDSWIREGADATTHHFTRWDGKPCSIVCIQPDPKKPPVQTLGLLVHEAVHVWQEFCRVIGEHNPGREIEAYAIQWICQELVSAYPRLKPQKQKGGKSRAKSKVKD